MIECIKFKSHNKGTLLGYADFFIPKWGVEIRGCTLHQKGHSRWVSLPSKEYEAEGQKKYFSIVYFRDKNLSQAFSDMAKQAIDDYCAKQNTQATEECPENLLY